MKTNVKLMKTLEPLTRRVYRGKLIVQKHSPEILAGVGVVGVAATAYLGYRCITKAKARIEEYKRVMDERAENIVDAMSEEDIAAGRMPEMSAEDRKWAGKETIRLVFGLAKDMLPVLLSGALTVASFLTSNHILAGRLKAVGAALLTTTQAFEAYRGRVAEEVGSEKEQEIYTGRKKVEEVVTDEKGKEKKEVRTIIDRPAAPFSYCFDESSIYWKNSAMENYAFCLRMQNTLNELLRAHGHLTINEVLRALDLKETPEGFVYGWIVKSSKNYVECNDPYIDFGISQIIQSDGGKFITNPNVWITLNPHGIIYDQI